MKYATIVPFSGFYASLHGGLLDDTLNSMFSDDDGDPYEDLVMKASDAVDWRAAHLAYAKEYTENFATALGLDLAFDTMLSPREYNFETDRIFAVITKDSLLKAYAGVDRAALAALVKCTFTSRDGFSSFYDPGIRTWPEDVTKWDHNQIGTLLQALANEAYQNFDQWQEYELMDSARGNGVIDNILCKNLKDADTLFAKLEELRSIA